MWEKSWWIWTVAAIVGVLVASGGWVALWHSFEGAPVAAGLAAGLGVGAGALVRNWLESRREVNQMISERWTNDGES